MSLSKHLEAPLIQSITARPCTLLNLPWQSAASSGWTFVTGVELVLSNFCAVAVDGGASHLRLEPTKNSRQAANPQHSENLPQPASLDQVTWDLKNLLDSRPIQSLDEQRDKTSYGGGFNRCIGVQRNPVAIELDK